MKKKNVQSLKLNKCSISNLHKSTLNGGTNDLNKPIVITFNPSIIDALGCMSEMGCTGGPDETMTCPLWSCHGCTGDL